MDQGIAKEVIRTLLSVREKLEELEKLGKEEEREKCFTHTFKAVDVIRMDILEHIDYLLDYHPLDRYLNIRKTNEYYIPPIKEIKEKINILRNKESCSPSYGEKENLLFNEMEREIDTILTKLGEEPHNIPYYYFY